MIKDRGFVLLNALVIVAAMSAAAVFVVAQSEAGRVRLSAAQTSDQLDQYLDGFEAYAMTVLMVDRTAVTTDDGDWRIDTQSLDMDRGTVSGTLIDVERRFNLNWLAAGNAPGMVDVLSRALAAVKARPQVVDLVAAAMSPGVPSNARAYLAFDPPLDPIGGQRTLSAELHDIAGLTPSDLDKLGQVATLAPPDSQLNINTASIDVVAAFLPDLTRLQVASVLSEREEEPFVSIDAFLGRVEEIQGSGLGNELDLSRFSVRGAWFKLRASATLEGYSARRETLFERRGNGSLPRIAWRVTQYP
ncbi:hypothetical protein GCM10007385_44300 [Tateyamaria omphalii]|uniref:type II secretion system minor pseudopilin GspK n=1 Tax=Tateyamaria omphalii TaxID=299262 RepID=UPI00167935E5|nr:type II secretion system minor pseudopilin GspK [Tateyamaria omphalii]GGX70429.1 hypothetical protein GCM10007385_44300 [Tateyamaria omphalii]